MIKPDKQINNNFMKYESIFLAYGTREISYNNILPYHEMKDGQYEAFYILDGQMSLHIAGMNGEEKITAVLQRGSFYTMCSNTNNPSARNSFFGKPTPSVHMVAFTKKDFQRMLACNPSVAVEFIKFYEDLVIMLQCEMKDVLFHDGRKRLCSHLIQCHRSSKTTELVTTQEEIGKHIGLDRTNVAKYLSELRKLELLETKRNRIFLLDLDAIMEIGEC